MPPQRIPEKVEEVKMWFSLVPQGRMMSIIEKLSVSELEFLSDDHIKNISPILGNPLVVNKLFSPEVEIEERKRRFALLSSEAMHYIIERNPVLCNLASDDQVRQLDLKVATKQQINEWFPSWETSTVAKRKIDGVFVYHEFERETGNIYTDMNTMRIVASRIKESTMRRLRLLQQEQFLLIKKKLPKEIVDEYEKTVC
jgi:hypothetical protein